MDRIVRNVKKTPPLLTVDILQNKRIAGLQQELSDVRKMLDMLLTLVDPEDVRAAFELRQVTPSHEELMELAEECVVPPELRGIQEENPWE